MVIYQGSKLEPKVIEVISIQPVIENSTGDSVYQVIFGRSIPIDQEFAKFIAPRTDSKPPRTFNINDLILYVKINGKVPYIIGSKWSLSIGVDGKLSLTPVK